jgi:hypothetical protein
MGWDKSARQTFWRQVNSQIMGSRNEERRHEGAFP